MAIFAPYGTGVNVTLNSPQTHTTLYYREGSSDKVYQASIEPQGEGFIVNFAYPGSDCAKSFAGAHGDGVL